jgi:hypothetical protein
MHIETAKGTLPELLDFGCLPGRAGVSPDCNSCKHMKAPAVAGAVVFQFGIQVLLEFLWPFPRSLGLLLSFQLSCYAGSDGERLPLPEPGEMGMTGSAPQTGLPVEAGGGRGPARERVPAL